MANCNSWAAIAAAGKPSVDIFTKDQRKSSR